VPELARQSVGWDGTGSVPTRSFTCPYCGNLIASDRGYGAGGTAWIYICHHCGHPTYVSQEGIQIPGVAPGRNVPHLPPAVANAYREARDSLAAEAPTASALVARKLLMNIAVEQGADAGKSFAEYVDYLAAEGYVPPNGKAWVDLIRKKGNEATHEIPEVSDADAGELLTFLEMLLTFIYDFPNRVPRAPSAQQSSA
jgi:predicted RNA-binding Zn-ribbon protein involved in translation (DUF1610 family)